MSEKNTEFEKWFSNKLAECRANNDMDMHRNLSRYVGFYQYGFEGATAEANKRIAELEREVAIARSNENHADDQRIKCIRKYKTQITELQASNNNLREALVICKQFITEAILDDNYHEASCGLDEIYNLRDKAIKLSEAAISATPAESLQAFENELLERAAKVAMDMPSKADEIHEYRYSDDCKAMALDISHAIRAIKEVK